MTKDASVGNTLREHRWSVAIIVAAVLALAAVGIVLSSKPVQALDCDPTIQDCSGGGTTTHIINTLTVSTSGNGTVTSSDGGINCGSDCSQNYNYSIFCDTNGDCTTPDYVTVGLNPSPAPGYSLVSWSGDCAGAGSCAVTMDDDRTVSAQFADLTNPTVSLTSPSNNTKVGTSFTASATASDGAGVASVQFLVDGVSQGQADTSPPTLPRSTHQRSPKGHILSPPGRPTSTGASRPRLRT
jgi:hypothetical protein